MGVVIEHEAIPGHDPVTLGTGSNPALALDGQELTLNALSAEDWSNISNASEDRTADMSATSVDELANLFGTLIADLRAAGVLT